MRTEVPNKTRGRRWVRVLSCLLVLTLIATSFFWDRFLISWNVRRLHSSPEALEAFLSEPDRVLYSRTIEEFLRPDEGARRFLEHYLRLLRDLTRENLEESQRQVVWSDRYPRRLLWVKDGRVLIETLDRRDQPTFHHWGMVPDSVKDGLDHCAPHLPLLQGRSLQMPDLSNQFVHVIDSTELPSLVGRVYTMTASSLHIDNATAETLDAPQNAHGRSGDPALLLTISPLPR